MVNQDGECDASGIIYLAVSGPVGRTFWRFIEPEEHTKADGALPSWPLQRVADAHRGRRMIATRDLTVGELIFTEEPFVQAVDDSVEQTVCHTCYTVLPQRTARSCQACGTLAGYCSRACESSAHAQSHTAECGVLRSVRASGSAGARNGVRGLRLFLRLLYRAAKEPAEFEAVEELTEHYSDAPPERARFLEGVAAQLIKLVPAAARLDPTRLARLVSRVHTNLFAVTDMAGVQYGSALYSRAGASFNHSCSPTAVASFFGRTLRLHTLRAVARGEEITISCEATALTPTRRYPARSCSPSRVGPSP